MQRLYFVEEYDFTLLVYQNHVALVKFIEHLHISHTWPSASNMLTVCNQSSVARRQILHVWFYQYLVLAVEDALTL